MAVFCNSFLTVQVITFNSRSISAAVSKSIETSHQEKEKKTWKPSKEQERKKRKREKNKQTQVMMLDYQAMLSWRSTRLLRTRPAHAGPLLSYLLAFEKRALD